jgi:hypothetical protein
MKNFIITLSLSISFSYAIASTETIIKISGATKTDSALVITGTANLLPEGTVMEAEVARINNKALSDDLIISTIDKEKIIVGKGGAFTAKLFKYGSLDGYNFPNGKYVIEIKSSFNRAWQSIEVAKKLGVALDELGRSDLGEPRLLPKSPDLVKGSLGVRTLKAVRSITIEKNDTKFSRYKSKFASLEIMDASKSPSTLKKISGNDFLAYKARSAMGQLAANHAVALICKGDFAGFGYIATDIYYSNGAQNRAFKINNGTTLIEACYQYEDTLPQ